MVRVKYFFFILLFAGIISCGNKNENNSEYQEDKTGQPQEDKEQLTEQLKEQPKEEPKEQPKTDSGSKTEELKFYDKKTEPQAHISAVETANYIGKVVTVEGFVADVYKTERVAYLNFVEKFPKNPFSGVIFAGKFDKFGDLSIYEGKNVEITGRISVYKEKPQIILDSKDQIKILE
jgi:DNA/RNA endonuclease YhcR with UshA esterase domain